MQVAFYAPMKPLDHPVPSGERTMGRLLVKAMKAAGHEIDIASHLRSRDGKGDPARQAHLARLGKKLTQRYLRQVDKGLRPRPDLWFTYHLYYKAADWIGPQVAKALEIPYVVAEASVAYKRANGPWDLGHKAVLSALDSARLILPLNPANAICLPDQNRLRDLAPFIDTGSFKSARADRGLFPELDANRRWIVTAAMMRNGDKLASYRQLADALRPLDRNDYHLLLIGDGPARPAVESAFSDWPRKEQVHFAGKLDGAAYATALTSGDLLAWPAVNEAWGMVLLEAQAAGLPVVACRHGGVASIVRDGTCGLLTDANNLKGFQSHIAWLLDRPERLTEMKAQARKEIEAQHSLNSAAAALDAILKEATE